MNDRPAVVSETGEAFGHAVVADRIARLASVLLQPKMAAGDVVALLSESSGASLEVVWAARQAGLVLLPLDPSLSVDEIAFVLNDSGAGVLVTSARYASVARSLEMLTPYLLARFSLDAAIDGHRQLALDRSTASPFRGEPAPAGTLHYTSSVTGRPTAYRVLEADSAELGAVLGEQAAAELGPDSVLVTACPVSDPVSVQLVTAVYAAGGTVVTVLRPTPDRLLHAISAYSATVVHLSPVGAIRLAKLPRSVWTRVGSNALQVVLLSAPSCPRDVLTTLISAWSPVLRQLHVLPGTGVIAALDSNSLIERPASVGRDPRGLLVIVDDDGNHAPPGVEGWIRPRRGEDTTSRDRGYLDNDGYLHLADHEVFWAEAGGVVVPHQIENALITHPAVAGAAVIRVTELGVARSLIAYVEVADRARLGSDLELELIEHLRARVPEEWLPRRINLTIRLPRTASGKLDKRRLTPHDGIGADLSV